MRRLIAAGLALGMAAGMIAPDRVSAQQPEKILPGQKFQVSPRDLPPPNATPAVANPPVEVARPGTALPEVPPGFTATLFAENLTDARWLAVAPNGDLFLAESKPGKITLLRDGDGDGKADQRVTFADGFKRPHGMAFHDGAFYVADTRAVWRIPYEPGQTRAGERVQVTPDGALGDGGGHSSRILAFSPQGDRFYVAIGSRSNIGVEPEPRATIKEFRSDGSGGRIFASGLRNPVGLAFQPGSGTLYTVVNERDGLGDGLVPDYLTHVEEGGFYGWPYSYIGANPQPGYEDKRPDLVSRTIVPDLLFQSHSAPLGLIFYSGSQFPAEYRGDAFVALHGSWNSGKPTGYMVVRVPFRDGRPAGGYEAFVTGFRIGGTDRARVWGRPVGLAVAQDGALLIADDVGETVWRISYKSGPGR